MDLLLSYDMDSHRPGVFMGHELLHYALFYCRIKLRHFKAVPQQQQAIFSAINGISEEGTADLIDKPFMLFDQHSPYQEKAAFLDLYTAQSGSSITKINQAFEQLADQWQSPYTEFAYWRSIVLAVGHVPGMYMGRIIQQQGLTNDLIKHIENPFWFFTCIIKPLKKTQMSPQHFLKRRLSFSNHWNGCIISQAAKPGWVEALIKFKANRHVRLSFVGATKVHSIFAIMAISTLRASKLIRSGTV